MTPVPAYTLCLWQRDGQLLLGMKKRGFGAGRWNGFGGKVKEGESIEEAARREMREESGLEVREMEERGNILFRFAQTGKELAVTVFAVMACEGEPSETDEMRPQWFSVDQIPFEAMWPDDPYWFPLFLRGKRFAGTVVFGEGDRIIHSEIQEIPFVEDHILL
jgi:8-oxo-dGTP diphosphatase / 2-hydroxy-dATP diphosphatase